jgi:hypothetical protein
VGDAIERAVWEGKTMSCGSRGFCTSATLLMMSFAAWTRAASSNVLAPDALPTAAILSVDVPDFTLIANRPSNASSMLQTSASATSGSFDPAWTNELSVVGPGDWSTSAVPHDSQPAGTTDSAKRSTMRDDLVVPLPAVGAGWLLLMGGALCKIGARVVRAK